MRKICFSCRPLLPANPTAFCHIKQAGCRVYCKHFDPSPSHSLFSELWKQFRREKSFPNKEFDNAWDYIPLRDLQDGGQTATASGRYSLTCKCTLLPAAAVSCLALLAQVIPKSIGAHAYHVPHDRNWRRAFSFFFHWSDWEVSKGNCAAAQKHLIMAAVLSYLLAKSRHVPLPCPLPLNAIFFLHSHAGIIQIHLSLRNRAIPTEFKGGNVAGGDNLITC